MESECQTCSIPSCHRWLHPLASPLKPLLRDTKFAYSWVTCDLEETQRQTQTHLSCQLYKNCRAESRCSTRNQVMRNWKTATMHRKSHRTCITPKQRNTSQGLHSVMQQGNVLSPSLNSISMLPTPHTTRPRHPNYLTTSRGGLSVKGNRGSPQDPKGERNKGSFKGH